MSALLKVYWNWYYWSFLQTRNTHFLMTSSKNNSLPCNLLQIFFPRRLLSANTPEPAVSCWCRLEQFSNSYKIIGSLRPNKGTLTRPPWLHLLLQKTRVHLHSFTSHISQPCLWKITCIYKRYVPEGGHWPVCWNGYGKCTVCRK